MPRHPAPPAPPDAVSDAAPEAREQAAPARGRVRAVVVGTLLLGGAAALFAASAGGWAALVLTHRAQYWRLPDLSVYYTAAASLTHHQGRLYLDDFGMSKLPYLYPPFAAAVFRLLLPLGFGLAKFWVSAFGVLSVPLSCHAALTLAGALRGPRRLAAALALGAAGLWLEPAVQTLIYGQINLLLMAFVLADLAYLRRTPLAGVGIGLAAGLKLTPGVFLAYLLLTRRYRAFAVGVGTFGLTALVAGWRYPLASQRYWGGAITAKNRLDMGNFDNQSLHGIALRFLAPGQVSAGWAAAVAVVGGVGLWSAWQLSRRGREATAVVVVGTVGLLVSPLSWSNHWVWLCPALACLTVAACRRPNPFTLLGPVLLVAAFTAWPMRVDGSGHVNPKSLLMPDGWLWLAPHGAWRMHVYHWNWWQTLLGSSFVLAGTATLLGLGGYLLVLGRVEARARRAAAAAAGVPAPSAAPAAPPASAEDAAAARPAADVSVSVSASGDADAAVVAEQPAPVSA